MYDEREQTQEQSAIWKTGAGALNQGDADAKIQRVFIASRTQVAVRIAIGG